MLVATLLYLVTAAMEHDRNHQSKVKQSLHGGGEVDDFSQLGEEHLDVQCVAIPGGEQKGNRREL
jgi:hypothetical protein